MSKESDDLEELLGKVTPEPWNVSTPVDGSPEFRVIQHGEYGHSDCGRYLSVSGQVSSHDATLITLAPSLAAEVLELRKLKAQLAAMTAERDALVGAAYAASAEWCRKNERHGSIPAYNILRLTPADAATALDHIRAQAKAEGMRKAAKEAGRYLSVADAQEAILAAAQKEAGK